MYIFLSMLAVTDLALSIVTIPTILGIYLFNSRRISHEACFAQMFLIHSLSKIESFVLLLMAFDRFIAIYNAQRYTSILTPPRISKMGLVAVDIMKAACSDTSVNSIYGLFLKVMTDGLDSFLIFLSYVMILKTVLSIASHRECLRALNTCVSHLCAVVLFYISDIGLSLTHRFGNSSTYLLQIILGYIYLLVPPLMNPIVYSVKSKHLRERIIRAFVK
ncbi:unnamed protein product [Caretta caretta]